MGRSARARQAKSEARVTAAPSGIRASTREWSLLAAVLVLTVATALVYANSLHGALVFDDIKSIETNLSIRNLSDLGSVLSPPAGQTVGGRPLVNLSLAINYAISGTAVWSYHLVNILIHLAAGLTLLGVLRDAFRRIGATTREGASHATALTTDTLALITVMLWLVHPLQTESVTYIIQRAESLVSLCYLFTLYAVIRSTDSSQHRWWEVTAVLTCAAGMACKEVMVGAPLVVLLYDRSFLAGSFREAWTRRRSLYLALAATWLVLGAMLLMHGRGATAGLATTISIPTYAVLQLEAVTRYLMLTFWPRPLILDYGPTAEWSISHAAWYGIVLIPLLSATVIAFWRRSALGCAGVIALIILAPSSSIVPIVTQVMAEHRVYLALAVVLAVVVGGIHYLMGRRSLPIFALWFCALAWLTVVRNRDYGSPLQVWRKAMVQLPTNSRAQQNLAHYLAETGDTKGAIVHLDVAIGISPGNPEMRNELGIQYTRLNRLPAALGHFESAIALEPRFAEARLNRAMLLTATGQPEEGLKEFKRVRDLDPNASGLHLGLAEALNQLGRFEEAVLEYQALAAEKPDSAGLRVTIGRLLLKLNRATEARDQFRRAVSLEPQQAAWHNDLGEAEVQMGDFDRAARAFEEALRLDSSLVAVRQNLEKVKRMRPTP